MGVVKQLGEQVQRTPGRPKDRPVTALEELRLEFESMGNLLQKRPETFVVLTELSLRAMRDPVMEKVTKTFDDSWRQHLSEIIRLGISSQERAAAQC